MFIKTSNNRIDFTCESLDLTTEEPTGPDNIILAMMSSFQRDAEIRYQRMLADSAQERLNVASVEPTTTSEHLDTLIYRYGQCENKLQNMIKAAENIISCNKEWMKFSDKSEVEQRGPQARLAYIAVTCAEKAYEDAYNMKMSNA